MTTSSKNQMLTSTEVAKLLHIHVNTARRWSNQGLLKTYRLGARGDRRFSRDDVMAFLNTPFYTQGVSTDG
jgi:excisionase family DNA binding protein